MAHVYALLPSLSPSTAQVTRHLLPRSASPRNRSHKSKPGPVSLGCRAEHSGGRLGLVRARDCGGKSVYGNYFGVIVTTLLL